MIVSGFQILMLSQCTQEEFADSLNLAALFPGMEDVLETSSSSEEEEDEQMSFVGHSVKLSIEDLSNLEVISLPSIVQPNAKNNEPPNTPKKRSLSEKSVCGHKNPNTGNVCQRKGKCPFHNPFYSKKISKRSGWTFGDFVKYRLIFLIFI